MAPALYVGRAICTVSISNRHVDDFQVQFGRTKQQIEISERIEVPEIRAIGGQDFVIGSANHLRSTERVPDRLAEQP